MWKKLFRSHILERGYNYYLAERIEILHQDETYIEALVEGSNQYLVTITLEEQVISLECDCPHAREGHHCKHMAAVLYYCEEENEIRVNDIDIVEEGTIVELVNTIDEKLLKQFMIQIFEQDRDLYNRFKMAIGENLSHIDIAYYQKQVTRIFNKYQDRYGYIGYENACAFGNDIMEFIDTKIKDLMKHQKYEEVFLITTEIFTQLNRIQIDDSEGEIVMLVGACVELWRLILHACDLELRRTIFDWCIQKLDSSIMEYLDEDIEKLLFDDFMEKEFLDKKLVFIDEKLSAYKQHKDSWWESYKIANLVYERIVTMQALQISWSIIDAYAKEYWKYDTVRKFYIEKYINEKEYNKAIEVLKESKELDGEYKGLTNQYQLQLKDLYKKTGDYPNYKNELWDLILHGVIEIYEELQALYTNEEWKQQREKVFSMLSKEKQAVLYKKERLYDRLLNIVVSSQGLYKLYEYENCLKKIYPKELLKKLVIEVEVMAQYSSPRSQYREIAKLLNKMKTYKGGKEEVAMIVAEWREKYKNRPAMMDEISAI